MSELVISLAKRPNIERPQWDQSTFLGRAKYFWVTTNPINALRSNQELAAVQEIVENYRKNVVPPDLTLHDLWRAKHIYDSAFHPETKEKVFVLGRACAMVPSGAVLCAAMMTFYKSTPAVVFWQWLNQSYNAGVNFNNRSGAHPISKRQLLISYVCATSGALVTALGLNRLVEKAPPLIGRFVPFCAVAAANCVNIPLMRAKEFSHGVAVVDEDGNEVGHSKIAAKRAVSMVVFSRIMMVVPAMGIPPFVMQYLENKAWYRPYLRFNILTQTAIVTSIYVFCIPVCLALFPQRSAISIQSLENDIQESAAKMRINSEVLYYNKGL